MVTHFFSALFFLMIWFMNLFGAEEKDFFLISIPKSGTHLSVKLLTLITDLTPDPILTGQQEKIEPKLHTIDETKFENLLLQCKVENSFAYNHSEPYFLNNHFMNFALNHPEYIKFLQIRDLRDILVSLVHYPDAAADINNEMGGNFSIDEMLTHVLSLKGEKARKLESAVQCMIEWIHFPDAVVLRFEDLIGPQGGGNEEIQKNTIEEIAFKLGISLSEVHMNYIIGNLFGNSTGPKVSNTFRKGQIGSWKEHFTPEHIELFEKNWSHYQVALGYYR